MRRRDGTQHDHSLETETDVAVRRLSAAAGDGRVTIAWDYPGRTLLEVRILRFTAGPAHGPDDRGVGIVYQGVTGSFRDEGLENGRPYVYSVFARHPGGDWVHWEDLTLTPAAGPARAGGSAGADGPPPATPSAALAGRAGRVRVRDTESGAARPGGVCALGGTLVLLAIALVLLLGAAVPAAAADGGQAGGAGGDVGATAAGDEPAAVAWDVALSDALVVALLGGRRPATSAADVELWPAASAPSGATVYLAWPGAPAATIEAELPVVRRRDPERPPSAPYTVVMHRVRASEVTGLRVLVSLDEERVLEVYPWDERADFVVHEDTTAPFSRLPWFTARAWVLLPVFAALAVYLVVRSWLRSRAWRRRLPSMSRHDRQFVGRMVVAVLMAAALAVMAAAVWRAVAAPIPDPDRLVSGDLSTWPLVLFPPALYAAALGLELTYAPHRVAWALVAGIAGVSCVYSLVAMQAATVTDLTLLYYILLGCLTLVAVPRAFSPGKLGWSRSQGRAGAAF